ncbi:MAG: Na/Pi cotransporter family protein [Bdellovibrionales bacterium]
MFRSFTIASSLILLHIVGAVCLLLWGTRMVKRGFTRAYGSSLRLFISRGTQNRFTSLCSGFAVTALLQSSTAATLLMLSFVNKHKIPLAAAIAFVIGADIATTIVAQILTFDFSWLSPAFLAIGIIGHMKYEHGGRKKHLFTIFIGLGLMLLSLALIRDATLPLKVSETLPLIMAPLNNDPIMAVAFAAILTWIIHSSLASILLFATFASNGIIDVELGLLLVVGTNIGGALISFVATYKQGTKARQITSANILMRTTCAVLFYIFSTEILTYLAQYDLSTERLIVTLHVMFNIVLGIMFLPVVQWVAKLGELLFKEEQNKKPEESDPLYLDEEALFTPVIALASAARETLRMSEMVEDMLERTITCFKQNTDRMAKDISREDETVDRLYAAIKHYLARMTQESLDPKEADRYLQILTFATNLEHVGDIIDKSLMDLAKKKIKKGERFSNEGWEEIKDFHKQVLDNMKLAQNLFISEDPSLARQLIDSKNDIRKAEQETSSQHFQRLREGLPETIATSSLHLDIIRDYRRINSYITTVAYSILETGARHANERKKH